MVGDSRGGGAGPWLAAGIALGVPATAFVWMVSRTWTPYLTLACVIGAVGVAMKFAHVFGAGAELAILNWRARDKAHTHAIVDGVARPTLTSEREQLALTQGMAAASTSLGKAAAVWERIETGAHAVPPAVVDETPIRVWDQADDDGGWDGE